MLGDTIVVIVIALLEGDMGSFCAILHIWGSALGELQNLRSGVLLRTIETCVVSVCCSCGSCPAPAPHAFPLILLLLPLRTSQPAR